jgi:hypothetical protein
MDWNKFGTLHDVEGGTYPTTATMRAVPGCALYQIVTSLELRSEYEDRHDVSYSTTSNR